MLYPQVAETVRAGRTSSSFPRTQRERVELSLRVNPPRKVRPLVESDRRRGLFR